MATYQTPHADSAARAGAPHTKLLIQAGQSIRVRMEPGQHYQIRRILRATEPPALEVPDNVIATRRSDALHLRYADGSSVTLEDFYSVCKSDAVCSVNLASDSEAGITLGGNTAQGGVACGDGTLVYAHGGHDVLMSMAGGQSSLVNTFTALGNAPVLTYLPPSTAIAAAESAFPLGYAAIPVLLGGGLAKGAGASGAGLGTAAASGTEGQILGTIQAGPVTPGNDLEVNIYAADGSTLLARHVAVDGSGHFSTRVGNYTGVVIARLVNKGTAADYLDEATHAQKDLPALSDPLTAVGVLSTAGSTLTLNLNALTTLAARKLGANPSAATVDAVNAAVAHAFGLVNLLDTGVLPTNGNGYNAADGLSEGEKYGAVLAALSGMDLLNGGSMETTLARLYGRFSFALWDPACRRAQPVRRPRHAERRPQIRNHRRRQSGGRRAHQPAGGNHPVWRCSGHADRLPGQPGHAGPGAGQHCQRHQPRRRRAHAV